MFNTYNRLSYNYTGPYQIQSTKGYYEVKPFVIKMEEIKHIDKDKIKNNKKSKDKKAN